MTHAVITGRTSFLRGPPHTYSHPAYMVHPNYALGLQLTATGSTV